MSKERTNKEDDIIKTINRAISELVYEKTQIIKAYNYYHGKRDPEQFRHLEENYGIGTATSVEFVPLVRKHIDVLIGEYLSTPLLPKISCKDEETLSAIHRDKQLQIHSDVVKELKTHLSNSLYNNIYPKEEGSSGNDALIEQELVKIQEAGNQNFISEFEIAGQNIVDWSMQTRNIDFANKRKTLLTDLLISGTCYYKVEKSDSKESVNLRILNPVNTFIDRNAESVYLKDSYRGVIRSYLTKDQILNRHGDVLTKDDLEELDSLEDFSSENSVTYLRSMDSTVDGNIEGTGILGGYEVTPLLPFERNTSKYFKTYPVYEVEWVKTVKENGEFITNRYEGIRIGTNIYIPTGKVEEVHRGLSNPKDCALAINGIFYADRNGEPISLILSTADLQDKFDMLNFYRDNVIAESGTKGEWIDLAYLPKMLGADLTERLIKWKAYKKQGLAIIDSSQEGLPPMNTTFGGFDDTVEHNAIQAIDLAIQRVEETCSTITGVFREKLGGIEQRDAVTNVQVGVRQSSYITKQYYQVMDLMTREILLDMLNLAKIVFKNGLTGTLILGERLNKIFTALPEHYSMTDFDIHITDSAEMIKDQETIQQLVMEFTKNGMADPEVILEAITATSLTKMKADVNKALNKKRKETNQIGGLTQQVEQLSEELKKNTSEASKLEQKVKQLNEDKINIEKEKLAFAKELEWYKAKSESGYKDSSLDLEKKRVQLEAAQLLDDNYKNDEIRNT